MNEGTSLYAKQIVRKSCQVKKGELVVVSLLGLDGIQLLCDIQREIKDIGADCILQINDTEVFKNWIINSSLQTMTIEAKRQAEIIEKADVYIGLNAQENSMELGDIPSEKMFSFVAAQKVVMAARDTKRSLSCMVPTASMAQANQMSTDAFQKYFYDAVTYDFDLQRKGLEFLKKIMEETRKVHIVAPDTDLILELEHIPAVICDGKYNLPDGEVFTAPKRNSANGKIRFNAPSTYRGKKFENIYLTFEDGKVVDAEANDPLIEKILDTDPGCRYLGEFAVGTNPKVTQPMANVIFDEKLTGSIHLALGNCYDFADNGNKATIHWDMILMLNEQYGGGQLFFDDLLIMDNGRFVVDELKILNN